MPVDAIVYMVLTDEQHIYVITENGTSVSMGTVTDSNAPTNPYYVAAFGNRIVVSVKDTPNYFLTQINLGGSVLDLNTVFTVNGQSLFNRASGVIRQFAVLHNQLYIFNDFSCDIWANIITQITVAGVTREFPMEVKYIL